MPMSITTNSQELPNVWIKQFLFLSATTISSSSSLCCSAPEDLPWTHHGHLESVDVERTDLPVATDVVNKFDEPVEPEDSRNNQDEDDGHIVTDAVRVI